MVTIGGDVRALGSFLDPEQHLSAHERAHPHRHRYYRHDLQAFETVAFADNEPGASGGTPFKHESPAEVEIGRRDPIGKISSLQNESLCGLQNHHVEPHSLGKMDAVTHANVLPPLVDPLGRVNIEADQIFQCIVRIEPTPALTELHEPRPYLLRWRVDADRTRGHSPGGFDQIITGKPHFLFLRGRAHIHGSVPARPRGDGQGTQCDEYCA